jgi:SPP1 gp7 family putative phage head morphogenesis protein
MDKTYRTAIEQIKIDGESFANSAMKGVYLDQAAALDELHKIIGKVYIDHAKDGMLSLTTVEKAAIVATTTKTLKDMGLSLGKSEVEKVTSILGSVFKDTYYKNIYTMENGMTVNLKFNILKEGYVNTAIRASYKEEFFSDRIWANKADMIDQLQSSIASAMRGDVTIDKIGRQIRDTFNVTAYESQRLVTTETARIQTQASEDMGRATGVEQVMWSATLDMLTSPECGDLDGQFWGIDEDHPEPPLHPNCRCCLCNVPPIKNWSPDIRRDNETKEIIPYQTYSDWAKDKGIRE